MPVETTLLTIALIVGFYMAWNIGANDASNAMGTSVGSGALTMRKAVMIAIVLEFLGAFFFGSHVSETVQKGIVDPSIFSENPYHLAYGMISALIAAGVWLQIATFFGWPVSTTHSIVGAIVGFGVVAGGAEAVHWDKVKNISLSWIISPLSGGIISFTIFSILRRYIFYSLSPIKSTKKLTPWLTFKLVITLTMILLFKGLKNLNLNLTFTDALVISLVAGFIGMLVSKLLLNRIKETPPEYYDSPPIDPMMVISLQKASKHLKNAKENAFGEQYFQVTGALNDINHLLDDIGQKKVSPAHEEEYQTVERVFSYLQVITACFMAFAHGANDVANAIGPLSASISVIQTGAIAAKSSVPPWILALGGVGIAIGLATWGWRVMETIGKKITELTPTRGFSAEFGAVATIVVASRLGMPISTTHTLVGSVLGVGLAGGIGSINLLTIRDIVLSWVITIPAGAAIAVVFFNLFKLVFP